jgi:hypothetical protein
MNGLTLNAAGTNRIFRPDGTVAIANAAGKATKKGTWRTVSSPNANRLHYTFNSEDHEIDVRYSFNDRNQLVAVIPATSNGGADSAPFTFPGRIIIDDNRDVAYKLLNEQGGSAGQTIVVHGQLSLKDGLDQLTITLPGGSSTAILGDETTSSKDKLEVQRNDLPGVARDTIRFKATTTNTFNGVEKDERADIFFIGEWGLNEDGLVFKAQVGPGAVAIQLGGSYKGVTAGLAYYAKDGDQQIAFTIHGEHKFKSGAGEGDVNWSLFLGHSARQLDARLELGAHQKINGKDLTLAGKLQFTQGPAGQKTDLQVEAKYDLGENGELNFRADVTDENGSLNYNLMLEGKYRVRNGNVEFLVKLDRKDNTNSIKLDLSGTFEQGKVKAHLTALLRQTDAGKMDLSLSFDVSVRFVAGQLIKPSEPVPIH